MKRVVLNIYNLHKENLIWARYDKKKLIIKYLLKNKKVTGINKKFILLKRWDTHKSRSLSYQTNVCKFSGNYKRTLDILGLNRHMLRQQLNVGKIPNIKKLSW